ncbi:hypothetical protein tb265_03210 [Gemmatimonadetes bacterium T265]|nr:hypothetical protein tb265_03210 [Gemmatimonadetes bacterium T265]
MHRSLLAAAVVFGAATTSACATKGYVNRQVEGAVSAERLARANGDSANARDIAAVRTDVQGLRGELQTLRTEFGARITAMEGSVKFALPVHFAYDNAAVRSEDEAALARFSSVVQKYYGGSAVTIEGFADNAGSTRYNLGLSQRRADAVRDYLVGHGLQQAQLKTVGYGKARQVTPGAAGDAPGAELNRRVTFVVETSGASTVTAMAQ